MSEATHPLRLGLQRCPVGAFAAHRPLQPDRFRVESGGGVVGFAGVEDVQVSAATAEGDDLPVEGFDEVDVVRFQVPEHQRQSAVPGETGGHATGEGRLAEAGFAEDEHGRVRDQLRALEPGDRVAAHRRTGGEVLPQRDADHGGAGADGERVEPADLHGRGTELVGRHDVDGLPAAATEPTAQRWPQRPLFP